MRLSSPGNSMDQSRNSHSNATTYPLRNQINQIPTPPSKDPPPTLPLRTPVSRNIERLAQRDRSASPGAPPIPPRRKLSQPGLSDTRRNGPNSPRGSARDSRTPSSHNYTNTVFSSPQHGRMEFSELSNNPKTIQQANSPRGRSGYDSSASHGASNTRYDNAASPRPAIPPRSMSLDRYGSVPAKKDNSRELVTPQGFNEAAGALNNPWALPHNSSASNMQYAQGATSMGFENSFVDQRNTQSPSSILPESQRQSQVVGPSPQMATRPSGLPPQSLYGSTAPTPSYASGIQLHLQNGNPYPVQKHIRNYDINGGLSGEVDWKGRDSPHLVSNEASRDTSSPQIPRNLSAGGEMSSLNSAPNSFTPSVSSPRAMFTQQISTQSNTPNRPNLPLEMGLNFSNAQPRTNSQLVHDTVNPHKSSDVTNHDVNRNNQTYDVNNSSTTNTRATGPKRPSLNIGSRQTMNSPIRMLHGRGDEISSLQGTSMRGIDPMQIQNPVRIEHASPQRLPIEKNMDFSCPPNTPPQNMRSFNSPQRVPSQHGYLPNSTSQGPPPSGFAPPNSFGSGAATPTFNSPQRTPPPSGFGTVMSSPNMTTSSQPNHGGSFHPNRSHADFNSPQQRTPTHVVSPRGAQFNLPPGQMSSSMSAAPADMHFSSPDSPGSLSLPGMCVDS